MPSNVIFAPTVSAYEPAFLYNEDLKVYFDLSDFNTISQIGYAHISVALQPSGKNALNREEEPSKIVWGRYRQSGIILNAAIEEELDKYYIKIKPSEINYYNKELEKAAYTFCPDQVYKIQIRLSSEAYEPKNIQTNPDPAPNVWLKDNADKFSEWSTICLAKAIYKPEVIISDENFSKIIKEVEEYAYNASFLHFKASYEYPSIKEKLLKYKVILYRNNNIIEESDYIMNGIIKNNNSILMTYNFKTLLKQNQKYKVKLLYCTENGYEDSVEREFTALYQEEDNPYEIIFPEEEKFHHIYNFNDGDRDSFIEMKLKENKILDNVKKICICRTDTTSNYLKWDTIFEIKSFDKDMTYKDFTIENGIYYKYGVYIIYNFMEEEKISSLNINDIEIARHFENLYLYLGDNKQLKIEFNPKINSYKYNVYESKIDTIGSRYPFITRNANVLYRTLPIEGLISYEMDEAKLFITPEELFHIPEGTFDSKDYDDYIYERLFREKVLECLRNGKPKLLKSPTEGNIIVRIMDINSTPNQQLSRKIYNFTCNAHEVADCTYDNLKKFNLNNKEE